MAIDTAVEVAVEEVADNLEELAEAARSINTTVVGYFIGGVCVGAAVGFYFGYRFNREKIKAEAFKQSEEELEKLREVYAMRALVSQPKPSAEEIIAEKGYSVKVPDPTQEHTRPLPAPVPVMGVTPPPVAIYEGVKRADSNWDYAAELAERTKERPYIIHQDEFNDDAIDYSHVTYTYFAQDDVLCDEDDRPLPHADLIVGQDNLKFGHGSDDVDVVFVRNDRLEIEMEICRSPGSYEVDVLGLDRNEES